MNKMLRSMILGGAYVLLLSAASTASAVVLGEPGYYGAIDVGHGPIPQLVYPQPVWIRPAPVGIMPPAPLYLRVPPRVWRHWPTFCQQYQACGRPVYFVREAWYQRVFIPYYREHPEFWPHEGGWHREGERWRGEEHHREGEAWHGREGEHEHH